ncbi:hypothetical protein ACFE04_014851 [Oxalis oulophora]
MPQRLGWTEFVTRRLTKDWQEYSASQKERKGKKRYQQRVGRKGYAGLREQMAEQGEIEPSRHRQWIKGRETEPGVIPDDDSKKLAADIAELIAKVEAGYPATCAWREGDIDDRLKILENQKNEELKSLDEDFKQKENELLLKINALTREVDTLRNNTPYYPIMCEETRPTEEDYQSDMVYEQAPFPNNYTTIGKNVPSAETLEDDIILANMHINAGLMTWAGTPDYNPSNGNKFRSKNCRLFAYHDGERKLVALGKTIADGFLTNQAEYEFKIAPDKCRVQVEVELLGVAIVPCPTIEILTVSQSATNHLTWPKSLLDFESNAKQVIPYTQENKKGVKKIVQKAGTYIEALKLWALAQHEDAVYSVTVPSDVFGHVAEFYISIDNIKQFCAFSPIDAVCISAYMRLKHEEIVKKKKLQAYYGFVYPILLAHVKGNGNTDIWAERLTGYMMHEYQDHKITFFPWLHE